MRFGKLAAKHDPRTLKLSALLAPDLKPPPDHFNALPRVFTGTGVDDPRRLFPMDGNQSVGCCTIAAAAHAETVWEAYCGRKRVPAKSAVLRDYFALTGGPDSGLVMLDVCNHWRQVGVTGEKILAFAGVDRRDHTAIKQAISLFGGLYLGFRVQEAAISDFNARRMWTPGPDTGEGHCIWLYAYTPDWVAGLTWGSTQRGTWEWFDAMADESFAILPGEASLAPFAPGLDLPALQAALQAVTA